MPHVQEWMRVAAQKILDRFVDFHESATGAAIERCEDVVEYLADQCGVYGSHTDETVEDCATKPCRCCWTTEVKERIWKAVRIEQRLERGRGTSSKGSDTR